MKTMQKYGSMNNTLYDGAKCAAPIVGIGCTMLSWTDRTPGTVAAVGLSSKVQPGFPTWVDVTEDTAKRTDKNGMSECQSYVFAENPNGERTRYTLRRDGTYREKGGSCRILFGRRDKYHDYSF